VDGVISTLPPTPEWSTKKIIFTLPLRRIENDFFLMDSGYIVRTEAAVRFILCQQSITQSHKRFYPYFIPPVHQCYLISCNGIPDTRVDFRQNNHPNITYE
jgi:hypothetical protein